MELNAQGDFIPLEMGKIACKYNDRIWKMYPQEEIKTQKTQPLPKKFTHQVNGKPVELDTPESGVKYLMKLEDFLYYLAVNPLTLKFEDINIHMVYPLARVVISFNASSGYPPATV